MTQVLTNLIANAIKFTEQGTIILNIRLAEVIGQKLIQLMGSDGIHMESEPDVGNCFHFELILSFASTETELQPKPKAVSTYHRRPLKALVEDREKALAAGMNDHLGKPFSSQQLYNHLKLWLEIQQKNVSRFQEGSSTPHETSSSSVKQISIPSIERQSILIVDDQPANIKILGNLLKSDYNIQVAKNGAKAIELSQGSSPPDLILLDIMMPDMDGYRVCHELKNHQNTCNIPIIFITAMDEASNETHGFHLGAVDFISKPFHPEIVKARVRTHMNLKIKTDLLENMSNIDGLTEIANRRYLDHTLQKVIHRPADLLARYGGEEFVVLLPETDATGVNKIAEDLRMAVNSINYPHEYSMVATHVTISVGCVSKVISDETPESLLQVADNALYEAKRKGRNCVVCLDQCS